MPLLVLLAVLAGATPPGPPDPEVVREALGKLAPGESVRLGPVTFTLHQRGESKPDADGWYPARSKGAGFRVRMPVPFVDMTGTAAGTDGVTIATHTIGGKSTEGATFNAMCMQRADGALPAGWVEKSAGSLRKDTERYGTRTVSVGTMNGLEVSLAGAGARRGVRYVGRFLADVKSGCVVGAEYPEAAAAALDPVIRAFIDSFAPP